MSDNITFDLEGLTPSQVSQLVEFVRSLRTTSTPPAQPDDESWRNASSTGWTLDHVQYLLTQLANRGKDVQLKAFNEAIKNGGHISRDEIFTLGQYEPTRQLKGWPRPFNSIMTELVDDHELPEEAEFPMSADFTEGSSFRQAYGYSVAPEIVQLVKEAMCDACWDLKATGTSGRKTPPHAALKPINEFREVASMGMRADEQDFICEACSKHWMHETGNHGMGWVETRH